MPKLLALSLVLTVLGGGVAHAGPTTPTVVRVSAFGADPSGQRDSAAAVRAAFRHAKSLRAPVRIVFGPGTYQLYPEQAEQRELYVSNTTGADLRYKDKRIGMLVEDMRGVVVDGRGAKLLFHGSQTAFAAIRSTDVTFTGFSFDYVAPKVVDATVTETGPGHRVLRVPSDSPYRVADNQVTWLGETSPATGQPYWQGTGKLQYTQVHDPGARRTWRTSNPLFTGVTSMTDLGGQRIRIGYASPERPTDQGLVYSMRLTDRSEPGAFLWQSKNIVLRDLGAHHLQSFGVVGQFSENITIEGVDFAPDPARGHTSSAFADHIQMSGVRGHVRISGNTFDGPHDDPINVHGTYLEVTGIPAPDTLRLDYPHRETAGFPQYQPGDEVELVDKRTMRPLPNGTARVTAVDGPTGQDHAKPLTTMTIRLDRPLPPGVTPGDTVAENVTWTPSVTITGNHFRNVPTRGVLLTTRRPILLSGNHFDAMTMASVYISADAHQWYESGPVTDLRITGNTFTRPANPVIFIEPTNQDVDPANPVHTGITVSHNNFELTSDVTVLDAKSTGDLRFRTNLIRRQTGPAAPPYRNPLFRFHGSRGYEVTHNLIGPGLNPVVIAN
ncbi:hypothetical protein JOF53_007228 [Crossiella equi]|uniref:Uncharacterized protein n=1 Tax=Crossiella equi TaxID=130796 RepID=A0ABS5APK3_9PSEU|nr:alpha-1,3-galactosidase [Crossiella equi]MBP2478356.1 hypothetical protein [Crossiella equi]